MLSYCLCLFWSLAATSWWQVLHSSTHRAPPGIRHGARGFAHLHTQSSRCRHPCLADESHVAQEFSQLTWDPTTTDGKARIHIQLIWLQAPCLSCHAGGLLQHMALSKGCSTARASFIREDLQHLWSRWLVFNAQLSSKVWCTFLLA